MRLLSLRLPAAAALVLALAVPSGASQAPHISDPCGDAVSEVRAAGQSQVVEQSDPDRDLRSADLGMLYGDGGAPESVRVVIEVCGQAAEGIAQGVGWAHDDDCWTTLAYLPPSATEQAHAPEVRLSERCVRPATLPGGGPNPLWPDEVQEVSRTSLAPEQAAALDGSRVTLTVPLVQVDEASRGRYDLGTVWTSTAAHVQDPDLAHYLFVRSSTGPPDVAVRTRYDGAFGPEYVVGADADR